MTYRVYPEGGGGGGEVIPPGTVAGQILQWNGAAWVASSEGTSTGQSLVWNGTSWVPTNTGGHNPGTAGMLRWMLNEAPQPCQNIGTTDPSIVATELASIAGVGTTLLVGSAPGACTDGMFIIGESGGQGVSGAAGAGYRPSNNAMTVEIFVEPFAYQATYPANASLLGRAYTDPYNAGAPKPVSLQIYVDAFGRAVFAYTLVAGATTFPPAVGSRAGLLNGVKNHVMLTYDGANFRLYVRGVLVQTVAAAGNIDWGADGPWFVGSNGDGSAPYTGIFDNVSVYNEVKNADWARDRAKLYTAP